jgi:hypothetical protein
MKKIIWTTFFWLIVVVGFVFYMKMYNVTMVNNFSAWLGATTYASQDTLTPEEQTSVMSGIMTIQTTLADMQVSLDALAGIETTPLEVDAVEEETLEVDAE